MPLDHEKRQGNCGYQGCNPHQGQAFVFVDVQDNNLACDGDQSHLQDDFDVNDICEQVCLDGFQQFDADQYQQEESENFEQLIDFKQDDGRRDDVPDDDPAQLDSRQHHHDDHHRDEAHHDNVFEFFEKCLHIIPNYRRRIGLSREILCPDKVLAGSELTLLLSGGPISLLGVVEKLIDIGIDEVSISDTVGKASPDEVRRLLDLLLPRISSHRIAMHFHDTYGRGVENVLVSRSYGIRIFDASVGALGGCPFAPGATGNVATEAVVKALEDNGERPGVDLQKLSQALRLLDPFLIDNRRSLPKGGSPACAACQFSSGEVCCRRKKIRSHH